MLIHNVEQGTPEWFAVRAGIPTASCFDKIITAGGKASTSAGKYQNLLLSEIAIGEPAPGGYKSASMERGNELEEDAAAIYGFAKKIEPVKVGFITDNFRTMGCSPDRLIGDDGLLEIKVPEQQSHVGYWLDENLSADYKVQIQGQLLVSERQWTDIISYHPKLPPLITRVERDEAFLATLRKFLKNFNDEMNEKKQVLIAKGFSFPEHSTDDQSSVLDAC